MDTLQQKCVHTVFQAINNRLFTKHKLIMKNTKLLLCLSLFSVAVMFSSCKKDPIDFLTGTSCWKQVKSEIKGSNGTWQDDGPIPACNADDCTRFTDDGKTVLDEGGSKCISTDPQTVEGTYTLSEDGRMLTLTQGGLTFEFAVDELTKDRMVLSGTVFAFQIRQTFEAN
jgi:hypothetical protein